MARFGGRDAGGCDEAAVVAGGWRGEVGGLGAGWPESTQVGH